MIFPKSQRFPHPPHGWQKTGLGRVTVWPTVAFSFSDVLNELQPKLWKSVDLWDLFGGKGLEKQNKKLQKSKNHH